MTSRDRIFAILEKWSERMLNKKKFNEIFRVDGIPIWYFLEPLMKSTSFLPRPLKSRLEIEKSIEKKAPPSLFNRIKTSILTFILRKGLVINEKIKLLISKSKGKGKFENKDVAFLGFTSQIESEKGAPEFLGVSGVANALKRRKIKPLILVTDPISKNSFFKLLKYENLLYSYITPGMMKKSKWIARDLNRKWNMLNEKTKRKLFTFDGECYWDFFRDEINFLFSTEVLFTLIKLYFTFKKIIRKDNIEAVYLTGFVDFYEITLWGAACRLNRKIIYACHGYGPIFPLYLRKEFTKNVFVILSGKVEKETLLRLGVKQNRIFITGSPFFDEIVKFKREKIKEKKKSVTLLAQPLADDGYIGKKEYFGYIRKFLIQVSKVRSIGKITIKLHPRDKRKSEYESVVESLRLTNVEVARRPEKKYLYSILSDSDLLISFGSTADIEGLMLDKDVIVIEGFKGDIYRKDPYKKAVIQVEKDENLAVVIDGVLNDRETQDRLKRKREEYLKKAFYKIDGKAHERVADLIHKHLK